MFCVGTTSCRTLESAAGADGAVRERSGWTDIFIYPGHFPAPRKCAVLRYKIIIASPKLKKRYCSLTAS